MHSKLGHSLSRELGASPSLSVCFLCLSFEAASSKPRASNQAREMGNSMKTSTAPPERPLPGPMGLDNDFLAVLCDYPSPDISPPIFRRGEKLRVISDEGGWWRAISLSTGRESYIPGMCVAKVYHGWLFEGLGRDKAEELLLLPDTKMGSFMIRESETKKGFYSLSVRHRQVKHYRIFRLPNNWYYISPRLTFQCLEDLVNHYSGVYVLFSELECKRLKSATSSESFKSMMVNLWHIENAPQAHAGPSLGKLACLHPNNPAFKQGPEEEVGTPIPVSRWKTSNIFFSAIKNSFRTLWNY
ncbi:src-like-adapter [Gracilinanus agilis]|uniref:src-like-adapter n=1 Tax=Gracilinanus agilis TaxID=191870 RepID=UPI001CFD59DF|nr:src-like-adapter [Gracilinanus agilis]